MNEFVVYTLRNGRRSGRLEWLLGLSRVPGEELLAAVEQSGVTVMDENGAMTPHQVVNAILKEREKAR